MDDIGPHGASAAYFVMNDAVMRRLLRHPSVVVSSDGSPTMLHPRGYGSFAKVKEDPVSVFALAAPRSGKLPAPSAWL